MQIQPKAGGSSVDDLQFDHFARTLAQFRSRRAATALLGGLLATSLLTGEDIDARKKKKKKKKKKKTCTPEPANQTCEGKCGSVTNNCQQAVECGACAPPCQLQLDDDLQVAIDTAAPGSTLRLCARTWNITTTLRIDKSITLVGAGINQTILDGGDKVRILKISGPNTVTLQDLTITRGNSAPSVANDDIYGGGIYASQAAVILRNVGVTNNVSGYGGGIQINSGSLVLASGTRVTGNRAVFGQPPGLERGGIGGGLSVLGPASLTLEAGSSVTNNAAINQTRPGDAIGGGILCQGTLTLKPGSTVSGNSPDDCEPANGACT
jgi:hypothetical protein